MKKILFLLFSIITMMCTSCNNHKVSSDELTFIKENDSTILVYHNGKPFNGIAYLDGAKGSLIATDNGKFFSLSIKRGRTIVMDIYPECTYYFDSSGNYISKDIFQKLYPDFKEYSFNDILSLCK